MKNPFLVLSIAVCSVAAVACGGPNTPKAGVALTYDKVPPGGRATANIDGKNFEVNVIREEAVRNRGQNGYSSPQPTRAATPVSDTSRTAERSAGPNPQ
jgi:hypothetical protein